MSDDTQQTLLAFLVDRIEVGLFAVDPDMRVVLWNRFMASHSGKKAADMLGRNLFDAFPELPRKWLEKKIETVFLLKNYGFTSWEQRPYLFRFQHNRPVTGGIDAMRQNTTFLPVKDSGGAVRLVCVTVFDYTDTAIYHGELTTAMNQLERDKDAQQLLIDKLEATNNQLLQSEKMAAIGQLAAGIAHEINNPIGFVTSNLATMATYAQGLLRLADSAAAPGALTPVGATAYAALQAEVDHAFIKEDLPALLAESKDGLQRVKKIVQDLKDFSRVDAADWAIADLRNCLDSTLNIVWNEIKYRAEVVKEYGEVPDVECMPAQINQVFMNLLVNAAQAMGDGQPGRITLRTRAEDEGVTIEVADSGCGIPAEILHRIFEPFFTTKPVGKGTGLGLSITYSIIKKHAGRLEVDSQPGTGSTFRVWLPLRRPPSETTS